MFLSKLPNGDLQFSHTVSKLDGNIIVNIDTSYLKQVLACINANKKTLFTLNALTNSITSFTIDLFARTHDKGYNIIVLNGTIPFNAFTLEISVQMNESETELIINTK